MDGNGSTAEPEGVEPRQECECNSLKEEVRRLQDKFMAEQSASAAVKKYLEGKVEQAAQKTANLQKQVADAEKRAESFSRGNDELSKQLANLLRQNNQLTDDARSAKEDLVEKLSAKRQKTKYDNAVLMFASLERQAETAEKKADEADRRVIEAEQREAKALEVASVAKRAVEESTAKAAEAVAEAARRRIDAESRAQEIEEQLSQSQAKLAEAEAAAAKALQSVTDAAIRATVTDLVLEAELLQTKGAINETLVKLTAAEKQAKESKEQAAYLETKRVEAEQLAEESVRRVKEEAKHESCSLRKVASEAMTRAVNSEAAAEHAQRRLSETRQLLEVEGERAADAAIQASNSELRAERASCELKSIKNKLANAERDAAKARTEAEVKSRDAALLETERDKAERRAAEALRKLKEVTDQAAFDAKKFAEATAGAEREADNLRKLASEAKNRAEGAEARAGGSEQDLQDALQQLAVQRQRADDAECRASEAELRLDGAKRQVADTERLAAIADRKALEFELKVKDAEKRADHAKREVIDANKSAAEAYRRIADGEKKVEEAREGQRQAEQRAFDAEANAREQVAAAERHANEAIRKVTELKNEKADLLRKIDALQRDLERDPRRSVQLRSVSGMDTMGSGIDPSGIPATPAANSGSSLADQPPSKKARYNAAGATREDAPFVRREAASGSGEPSAAEPSTSRHSREADVIKPGGSGVGGSTGGAHQITHEPVDSMLVTQFRPVEVVVDDIIFNSEPSMTSQGSAASTGSTQLPRTYGKRVQYKKRWAGGRSRFRPGEDAALKKILVDNGYLSADGKPFDRFLRESASLSFRTFWHTYQFKGKLRRRNEEALHARCIRLFSKLDPVQKPRE